MHRRAFLGALASLAATAVLDPERLLWVPGQKTIFVPKPQVLRQVLAIIAGPYPELGWHGRYPVDNVSANWPFDESPSVPRPNGTFLKGGNSMAMAVMMEGDAPPGSALYWKDASRYLVRAAEPGEPMDFSRMAGVLL